MDKLIESLENDAIKAAFDANFNFNQLAYAKNVLVTEELIFEKRNQKYIGWDCEKLIASIDSKIEVMKNSLAYFENIEDANSNFRLKLSNLYFQILLLVLLINQSNKWHS